jgi:Ca2+-binding EF-hand superfamily protein
MDSAVSGLHISADHIPDEDLRQMFFLREQLGGCQSLMRGEIEELYQEQRRLDREQKLLRGKERREMSRMQRITARQQRLEAMDDSDDESMIELKEAALKQRRSAYPEELRKDLATQRRLTSKVEPRGTIFKYLKHKSTKQQRNNAVSKLRKSLKSRLKQSIFKDGIQLGAISAELRMISEREISKEKDPKYAPWLEHFKRYVGEDSKAPIRDLRSLLNDIGIKPHLSGEKQAIAQFIDEEKLKSNKHIDFSTFVCLATRCRELRNELMRPELDQLYKRGLDANQQYNLDGLKATLESLGCANVNGEAEWAEVMQIYEGYDSVEQACKSVEQDLSVSYDDSVVKTPESQSQRTRFRRDGTRFEDHGFMSSRGQRSNAFGSPMASSLSPTAAASAATARSAEVNLRRKATKENAVNVIARLVRRGSLLSLPNPTSPFEVWEMLFYRAKERLTVMRRAQERAIAKEMNLTSAQLEHFRSDLIELYGLFQKFDEDGSGSLQEEEVHKCLMCCGLQKNQFLDHKTLVELIVKAKHKTEEEQEAQMRGDDDLDSDNEIHFAPQQSMSRYISEGSDDEYCTELNFAEFLTLMAMLRKINREAQHQELKVAYYCYDADNSGLLQVKELLGLFASLGLTPKTREEQQDIRMLLDEVDENGDGEFNFAEFEILVQRVHERLDRMTRKEEETYALEIGLPASRCHELQDVFRHAQDTSSMLKVNSNCLSISELRRAMQDLYLRYSSEELLQLFHEFGREETSQDKGGVDGKGFLRMMHAIEIAKTHGQGSIAMPRVSRLIRAKTCAVGAMTRLTIQPPGESTMNSARPSIVGGGSRRPSIMAPNMGSRRPSMFGAAHTLATASPLAMASMFAAPPSIVSPKSDMVTTLTWNPRPSRRFNTVPDGTNDDI